MEKNSNTVQAMWIGIGSLCSFLFSIVSAAVLSRFLIKSDYGTYKQVMYVYSTLLSVFTLGLPLAYSFFLPRVSPAEGKTLVSKINLCFVVLGLAFSFLLFWGSDTIAYVLRNPELAKCLRIFSPVPTMMLPTMGLQGVLATYRKTEWNAIYVLSTRILMLFFVAMPVVLFQPSVEIALWGFNFSSFISCLLAFWIKNIPFKNVKGGECKVTYKAIFLYSLPLMMAGMLGVAIKAADQFFVSRYYGQEVFADFANGSLELPFVGMVLSAGGTVLLPVFSRMISDNVSKSIIIDLWERTSVKAAYLLYPWVVFCIFFARQIMVMIYGDAYESSAVYFKVMLLSNFFTVIQFYPIILAIGKTKEYAYAHICAFVLVWGLEFLVVSLTSSAIYVSIVSMICHIIRILIMIIIIARAVGIPVWLLLPFRKLCAALIPCIIAGVTTSCIVNYLPFSVSNLVKLVSEMFVFASITLFVGKVVKVDYLGVIRPLTDKYFKLTKKK